MRILKSMLRGRCVYWPPGGSNLSGAPVYGDPKELACRWEDAAVSTVGPGGREVMSQALVYLGEDVLQGGVLVLAKVADIEDLTDPFANPGPGGDFGPSAAYEIKRFEKMPTLKKKGEFVRIAFL